MNLCTLTLFYLNLLSCLGNDHTESSNSFRNDEDSSQINKISFSPKANQDLKTLYELTDSFSSGKTPVYDSCTAFLKEFGKNAAKFIQCSVEKARPFRFCESCVVEYQRSLTTFNDILQDDPTKSGCRDILLKADRIQVLEQVHNNIKDIWNQAYCNGCFKKDSISEDKNGTVTFEFSEIAINFNINFYNVTTCINSHTNISVATELEKTFQELNTSVCDDCLSEYVALNKQFKEAMKSTKQKVCMDLVDMMNYTRITWGFKLNCTKSHSVNAGVIIISCLVAIGTTSFYVVTGLRGRRMQKKIMKQKRMSSRSAAVLYGSTIEVEIDQSENGEDGLDGKVVFK